MRPVPDSNFSCWKIVANRELAPHLDYVEYDASLFGCQASGLLCYVQGSLYRLKDSAPHCTAWCYILLRQN